MSERNDNPAKPPVEVKYVKRDDLLSEAGLDAGPDYVLAVAAASMLLGMVLMTCAPVSMAAMINSETSALGAAKVGPVDLFSAALLFVFGLWAVVAGTGVGYRLEWARKALIAWSLAWIVYFVGIAIIRITVGGVVAQEMRLSQIACFIGFAAGVIAIMLGLPVANLRHLTKPRVKATFRTFREARAN